METEMRTTKNTSDIRSLTDAELDEVNGGTFNDDQIVNVLKAALSFGWLLCGKTGTLNALNAQPLR
jgi:hypothetical protein